MTRIAAIVLCACALGALAPGANSAPATAQQIPIQGVARDPVTNELLPGGDVVVRIYADSIGGSPLYASGAEFAGAIQQGIFDIVVGGPSPVLLDGETAFFLELDVAGTEVLGDAAGGRWRFFPGGGSHARGDLEARLDSLENAMGLPAPATARVAPAQAGRVMVTSSLHPMIGFGAVSAPGGAISGNLLLQPVGSRQLGPVRAELGPVYLFAPTVWPAIRSIRDVANDQGRSVRVRWRNDLRERLYSPTDTMPRITTYTLYRRVGAGSPALAGAPGQLVARPASTARTVTSDASGTGTAAPAAIDEATALPPGEWDVLTSVPATLDSSYQTVVSTLCDSNSAGLCYSVFLVRAITDQTGRFYDSFADSGYSVDNIAPGVPQGLTAQTVPAGNALSWQPSPEADFQYFRVYRGTDPGFTPGPATLVQSTAGTGWTDPAHGSFTYKLTALDANGNESAPASVVVTVGVENTIPARLAFGAVAPNPFRRDLSLVVEVPRACGTLDLSLFDLAGRRIRTLVASAPPAGRYTYVWDGRNDGGRRLAPGVYVARLSGAGRTITRRVTLLP